LSVNFRRASTLFSNNDDDDAIECLWQLYQFYQCNSDSVCVLVRVPLDTRRLFASRSMNVSGTGNFLTCRLFVDFFNRFVNVSTRLPSSAAHRMSISGSITRDFLLSLFAYCFHLRCELIGPRTLSLCLFRVQFNMKCSSRHDRSDVSFSCQRRSMHVEQNSRVDQNSSDCYDADHHSI
jgi:hypothetical protein